MKKAIAPFLATLLVLAAASTALAAKPDDVWQYSESGSGLDEFYTGRCGVDVWLTYNLSFSAMRANSTFHVERFRTGPGGSITQVVHLTFRYPTGFETIGDPESGTWSEVYREVAKGSFVLSTPGDGVVYRDAGYAALTWRLDITPEGETMSVSDEVYHGQMPAGDEDIQEIVCAAVS